MLAIARAGSQPGSPVFASTNKAYIVEKSEKSGPQDEGRPWRWIAAVTEDAEKSGHHDLIPHAALFTFFYRMMASTHTVADQMDMRLPAPTRHDRARIYSVALRVMPSMNQNTFVVRHSSENAMQIRDVVAGCATDAVDVSAELDSGLAAVARRLARA